MLPAFSENPFKQFPIEKLKDVAAEDRQAIFSLEQEKAFFAACSPWQEAMFRVLASFGLRLGELTHLLVENIDLANNCFSIRSKPELFWSVKTGRERKLPLTPVTRAIFAQAIGNRKAGFVFLHADHVNGRVKPAMTPASPAAFRSHCQKVVSDLLAKQPDADERAQRREVVAYCRSVGQVPEKRVRDEFLKLRARK